MGQWGFEAHTGAIGRVGEPAHLRIPDQRARPVERQRAAAADHVERDREPDLIAAPFRQRGRTEQSPLLVRGEREQHGLRRRMLVQRARELEHDTDRRGVVDRTGGFSDGVVVRHHEQRRTIRSDARQHVAVFRVRTVRLPQRLTEQNDRG